MPRLPLHALIWSRDQGLYELYTQGQLEQRFRPGDEAGWLAWLREVTSFAFQSLSGNLNVYHEARPHGGQYWYAYHTTRRRTRKRYLGRTARVSLARLEETAQVLSRENEKRLSSAPVSFLQSLPEAEPEPMLLLTKLSPPRLPNSLVERDRLLAALDGALSTPLTLLAASAGWGKTTLLATWASRHPQQVAWLSLDALDNDPFRFWAAVIVALRTRLRGVGALALARRGGGPGEAHRGLGDRVATGGPLPASAARPLSLDRDLYRQPPLCVGLYAARDSRAAA